MKDAKNGNIDGTFKYLLYSRAFRSVAIIYMSLAFSLYLTALGVGVIEIGLIAAGAMAFMVLATTLAGFIGDRHGYRVEMLFIEILALSGTMLIAFTMSLTAIMAGMIMVGLGGGAGGMRGAFSPGTNAFIANNYKDEKVRVGKYSLVTIYGSAFAICGSILLSSVSPLSSYVGLTAAYRYIFSIAALMMALSTMAIFMLHEEKRPAKTSMIMKASSFRYSVRVMISNVFGGAGLGLAIPLLPLWFKLMYGTGPFEMGIVFGLTYIATTFGAFASSNLARRISTLDIASYTRMLSGTMLVAMALSPFFALAAIFYVARAALAGLGGPSRTAISVKGIDEEDYGTATSMQGVALRVSQLSSGASGYLLDAGLPLPLFIGGAFQFFSGVSYRLLFKNSAANKETRKNNDLT